MLFITFWFSEIGSNEFKIISKKADLDLEIGKERLSLQPLKRKSRDVETGGRSSLEGLQWRDYKNKSSKYFK